jgi:hypothetical protein
MDEGKHPCFAFYHRFGLNMKQETKIKEEYLYEIWKEQNFKKNITTPDGQEIVVIDYGTLNNHLPGPDFKNATIKIGSLTYVGDIEIDNSYTDWKIHGHNIDSKYAEVILHVSLINRTNQGNVYTRDGRKIPSICLWDYIDKKNIENLIARENAGLASSTPALKCYSMVNFISQDEKESFIIRLGVQRFEKKRKNIFQRLKELQFLNELGVNEPVISYDLSSQFLQRKFDYSDFTSPQVWQQLLYEMVFEALGYNKNRDQLFELAKSADIKFLLKIEKDGAIIEKYEGTLLKISGLLPKDDLKLDDCTKKYLERLNLHWSSIQPFYDGEIMDESSWNFFRMRPQNFPTVRIAGGARIIYEILHNKMINKIIKMIDEIHNLDVLAKYLRTEFIIKAEGFWKDHYVIDQSTTRALNYFIGASRADEIIINIVLPYFSIYFDVFGNSALSQKVMKLYSNYTQSIENKVVTEIAELLDMQEGTNRTIISQGMHELFRSLCSRNKCLECEIGKAVFN